MANSPYLSDTLFQIGYVVPDLNAAVRFFKDQLGVPEFLVLDQRLARGVRVNRYIHDYIVDGELRAS